MLTSSTIKGPVATARGSVTIELIFLRPTLTFNYTTGIDLQITNLFRCVDPKPRGSRLSRNKKAPAENHAGGFVRSSKLLISNASHRCRARPFDGRWPRSASPNTRHTP